MGQVEGAVYWADKVVSLSTEAEENPENVYSHRAATNAMRNNLHKSHVGCCQGEIQATREHSSFKYI